MGGGGGGPPVGTGGSGPREPFTRSCGGVGAGLTLWRGGGGADEGGGGGGTAGGALFGGGGGRAEGGLSGDILTRVTPFCKVIERMNIYFHSIVTTHKFST